MADNDTQFEERTEQPSEKKLADAKRRGQVPRSRELTTMVVMLVSAGALLAMQPMLSGDLQQLLESRLEFSRDAAFDAAALPQVFGRAIAAGITLLLPFWLVVLAAAVVGPLALGGWSFSFEALAPNLDKLNPVKGIKRIFGWNGLVELAKALAKFLVVGAAAALLLWQLAPQFIALSNLGVEPAIARAARLALLCFLGFAATLVIIAGVDVPFQCWQFRRRMRMTKQEQKDEQKETDGRPEVRQRIRNAQHEIATQRMMTEVPKADVVAMNPTHYAVALRYDAATMKAPKVVAKGSDLVALAIRRIAETHGVPIFEHPPLARALFHNSKLGQQIAPRLYVAVAQVLTYVYQLNGKMKTKGGGPQRPELAIDEDLILEPRERRRRQRMETA
jgi:flagellar biosynthesis protein FlhB